MEASTKKTPFVEKYQPLFLPLAILLGGAMVALAVYTSNGKTGSGSTAGAETGSSSDQQAVETSVDDDAVMGSADAKATIVEFSDYQCPYCRVFWKNTFPQLKSEYIDKGLVRFVYRDFPLDFHEMAQKYAEATECAADQDKFWEMHDKIFAEQEKKGSGTTISGITVDDVKKWAQQIGLDSAAFDQCLNSDKYAQEVKDDLADGEKAGVSGTPSFVINGQLLEGAQPFSAFKAVLDKVLAQ
jgi:protein-disulfide isomerase